MADRRVEVVNRRALVTVSGAALIAPLVASQVQAQTAPDRAAAEAAAAQASAQYQAMLDIQAMGDDAAAIAARQPKSLNLDPYAAVDIGETAERKINARFNKTFSLWDYLEGDPSTGGEGSAAWNRFLADVAGQSRDLTLHIPAATYEHSEPILIPSTLRSLTIEADRGLQGARLIPLPGIMNGSPYFYTDGDVLERFHWRGGTINGGGFANYFFASEEITHSSFEDVVVAGMTGYAIRANNGYSNRFTRLEIFTNGGGGLDLSGVNINNVNLDGCKIYANDGIGVLLGSGWGVTLNGCLIEVNKVAGVVAYAIRGLKINGGYFERNGQTGVAYTAAGGSPEDMTVKADIHLLCDGRRISYDDPTQGVLGAVIDGVSFTPYGTGDVPTSGLSQDCIVFATSMDNLRITNNDIVQTDKVSAFLGTYNQDTDARCSSAVLEQNTLNDVVLLGSPAGKTISTIHNLSNRDEPNTNNYAPQTLAGYGVLAGSTGSLANNSTTYGDFSVWKLEAGDALWGGAISLDDHPELQNKHIWFGLDYRVQDAGTTVRLQLGGSGVTGGTRQSIDDVEVVTATGTWNTKSVLVKTGGPGTTIFYGLSAIGAATNGLLLSCPRICVVGVNAGDARRGTRL